MTTTLSTPEHLEAIDRLNTELAREHSAWSAHATLLPNTELGVGVVDSDGENVGDFDLTIDAKHLVAFERILSRVSHQAYLAGQRRGRDMLGSMLRDLLGVPASFGEAATR